MPTRFVLSLIPLLLPAVALRAASLDEVLARMDQSASSFRGLTAKLKRVEHTAVINDDTTETGSIAIRRPDLKTVQVLIEIAEPDAKSIGIREKKVNLFFPKLNLVQVYDLGKYDTLVTQSLLIGFGTSGKELAGLYTVKLAGEETVDGQRTARLDLAPKTAETRKHISRIEIWISEAEGHTVRQKVHKPSGDYTLVSYAGIQLNPSLSDEQVRQKLPKNVKREYPLK
ncbi:MAG: outer membrane lipoprotein carrier protein LolA [Acidobacteria bacterium]|nr:outer membrane lipoprotein carrier protein LolA [Acidobacteriota bacterium]